MKINKLKLLPIAIISAGIFFTQPSHSMDEWGEMKRHRTAIQKIPYTTVLLTTEHGKGTGFFYITPQEKENPFVVNFEASALQPYFNRTVENVLLDSPYSTLFVLTNKHVLTGDTMQIANCSSKVRFSFNFYDGSSIKLKELILPTIFGGNVIFNEEIEDKQKEIDICAINISNLIKGEEDSGIEKLFYYAFTEKSFVNFHNAQLFDDVAMIGYPKALYDQENNLPITRRGVIASVPEKNWNGHPEFLIDCACFSGSSGSPILRVETEIEIDLDSEELSDEHNTKVVTNVEAKLGLKKLTLLGLLWGGHMQTSGGEMKRKPLPIIGDIIEDMVGTPQTRTHINLGYVVKAQEIKNLLNPYSEEKINSSLINNKLDEQKQTENFLKIFRKENNTSFSITDKVIGVAEQHAQDDNHHLVKHFEEIAKDELEQQEVLDQTIESFQNQLDQNVSSVQSIIAQVDQGKEK